MPANHDIPRQHPFSLYDVIGYFIPGSIFWLLLALSYEISHRGDDFYEFISSSSEALGNASAGFALVLFILFFSVSYVTGQVISKISNIVIERSRLCRAYNVLSYVLLGFDFSEAECQEDKESNFLRKQWRSFRKLLLKTILIHNCFYEWFLERIQYHLKKIEQPKTRYGKKLIESCIRKILEQHYDTSFENEFQNTPLDKLPNYFQILYHHVFENSNNHLYKIQNYVALYGFLRNISMTFTILFWANLFMVLFLCTNNRLCILFFAIICSILSYVTLVGFCKYKKRYTQEVLYVATVLSAKK